MMLRRTRIAYSSPAAAARRLAWHTFRRQVWERDHGRCVIDGWVLSLEAAEVHHRKLKSRGGQDDHPTCVTLCGEHHRIVHANPAWATCVGLQVPSWAEPSTWPVLLGFDRTRWDLFLPMLWQVPSPDGEWLVRAPHADQHEEIAPWVAA